MLDFKGEFKYFIDERIHDIREELPDQFYSSSKTTVESFINELKEKNKDKADILESAIRFMEITLSATMYKQGFEDGKQFQQIAQPYIEIED